MKIKKNCIKLVFATAGLAAVLAVSAIAALGQGESATCPKDGQQAQRVNVEQVHSRSCPEYENSVYNAERDTYSHNYINGPLVEVHTFSTITCLR
jgi:hypothetical protein